jgi:hypothetical protein
VVDHVLGQVQTGANETAQGCMDCGATGYRLKYSCPWYKTIPIGSATKEGEK